MKVAFVAARTPYPCDSGGRIRTYHLLREAARRHDVTLMTAVESAHDLTSLHRLRAEIPELGIRWAAVPPRASRYRQLLRLGRLPVERLPYTWTAYVTRGFRDALDRWLAAERFDLLHCDHVQVADMLLDAPTPPRLLNAHNVESVLARRMATRYRGLARALASWQARKIAAAERRCYRSFERAAVVSALDGALLTDMVPGLPFTVVPNGVDAERFAPGDGPPTGRSLVFTGAMDWAPNADGVAWFVREVLPRIRRRLGDASLTVVGRNPAPAMVRALGGHDVRFTGTVDDVRPFLRAASVVVVPLHAGGGTRLKILEAWSMAKAVVSTSIGAEGLPGADSDALVIADSPDAFATSVVTLLLDDEHRRRLGLTGRRLIEERFAWPIVGRSLSQAYEATVAARHATERSRCAELPARSR